MIYKEKLKFSRERLGISQKDMLNKLNLSKSGYSQYESERIIMPTKYLIEISKILDVSLDYIFNFTDTKQYENIKEFDRKTSAMRLKEFRKENKLTQTKLGQILNASENTIGGYEKGRYIIATPFLYTICKKYNISADYLLGRIDTPKYLS